MNASDILRRIQSQTQFEYTKAQFFITQPSANLSTCSSEGRVKINYSSYEQQNTIALGKYYANGCSSTTISPIVNSGIPRSLIARLVINVFFTTNTLQTYIVPGGTAYIDVYLWGSGGAQHGPLSIRGGSGGFVSGRINAVADSRYYIIVGGNVSNGLNSGGGAPGGPRGGGFSGIFSSTSPTQGTALAIAGGGGGSGYNGNGFGGGGGFPNGLGGSPGGGGGTQLAGGTSSANAGAALQGGAGLGGDNAGGGGGGGYFGGGAGVSQNAGGGGSSFLGTLLNSANESGQVGGGSGVITPPGGTSSAYYLAPYGRSDQPGYVVITALTFN